MYYIELSRTIYGKDQSRADFDEFWKKEGLRTNEEGKIDKKTLVTASGHEWAMLTK